MANLLITGASGGIGQHLCRFLAQRHQVIRLGRRHSASCPFEPCDLVTEQPRMRSEVDSTQHAVNSDWIIHLATTYRVEDDLAMLDNLIKFADDHGIENVLYVSSWVVHFPRRPISASYIEMKRRCEHRLLNSGIRNPRIIRPSVVVGPGLAWTRILKRLAPFAALIPPRFSRSFVTIDEVNSCIENIIGGSSRSVIVTCLGQRMPLAEKAREHGDAKSERKSKLVAACLGGMMVAIAAFAVTQFGSSLVGAVLVATIALAWLVRQTLPSILGSLSDYFAGFVDRSFDPQSEADVIALCHRSNHNFDIRGFDNARLYFQRPNDPRRTTVCLRQFAQVLSLDRERNLISVQAGANFGTLLPLLESSGLWLENYPNYHFISVGACIATAVHGSNLDKPFLSDLIESIRVYDRDEDAIIELTRDDERFARMIFDPAVCRKQIILSASIRTCTRQYYQLSTQRQLVDSLRFDDAAEFTGAAQHYEVRINSPMSRSALLQSYRQVSAENDREKGLLTIKADSIGRRWNLLQRNRLLSTLTSALSRCFINYEWFFTPQEFARFWQEISSNRPRYRMYKLLVRYNRKQPDRNTSYHGTVSIDVTIFNSRKMLDVSADLYQRYRPLEHLGKYSIARYIHHANEARSVVNESVQPDGHPMQAAVD